MTTQATIYRVKELIHKLQSLEAPDDQVNRHIAALMHWQGDFKPTSEFGHAKSLVKRYYQSGQRQYLDGTWGAYVEVNCDSHPPFVWANHKIDAIALTLAALKSHLAEMEDENGTA